MKEKRKNRKQERAGRTEQIVKNIKKELTTEKQKELKQKKTKN